jgi:hypothetical protein
MIFVKAKNVYIPHHLNRSQGLGKMERKIDLKPKVLKNAQSKVRAEFFLNAHKSEGNIVH